MAGKCNGFSTKSEGPALACKEENVGPFTLPQEALVFQPSGPDTVCEFKNGDKERKIHCNIKLSQQEQEALEGLQKEAANRGLSFLPSITVMATRFLSRARGDPNKALTLMQATQDWRLEYFKAGPVTDAQVFDDLKHGIVYFSGRDSSLRPTIIVRPRRIPQEWYKLKCIDRMIKLLIFCVEYMLYYMLIPGRIENNNIIVDLKGLGITQLPISALSDIYKVMSHHYIGRVFRFYVVNLSGMLNMISGAVTGLLTDRQKQKLCILNKVEDLGQYFALHQLEEDLGGTAPIIKDFFPFPMPAGPFGEGVKTGARKDAVKGCHRALNQEGKIGHLWDPAKSDQENADVGWSSEAYDIFQKCNMPVPPNCPVPKKEEEAAVATPKTAAAEPPEGMPIELAPKLPRASLRELGIASCDLNAPSDQEDLAESAAPAKATEVPAVSNTDETTLPPETTQSEEDNGIQSELQDDQIKPKGFFFCGSCTISGGGEAPQ